MASGFDHDITYLSTPSLQAQRKICQFSMINYAPSITFYYSLQQKTY